MNNFCRLRADFMCSFCTRTVESLALRDGEDIKPKELVALPIAVSSNGNLCIGRVSSQTDFLVCTDCLAKINNTLSSMRNDILEEEKAKHKKPESDKT